MASSAGDIASRAKSRNYIETHLRLLGILPLIFFTAHGLYYVAEGGLPHMLWMCNFGNLLLAIGMIFYAPPLIRLAVIWLIPGLPLWFGFVALGGGFLLTSLFSHVGGLVVGMIAIYVVRTDRYMWLYSFGWFLVLQHISRLVTPPELNVNVAHSPFQGMEPNFSSYFEFWAITTMLTAMGLWLLGLILQLIFYPKEEETVEKAKGER